MACQLHCLYGHGGRLGVEYLYLGKGADKVELAERYARAGLESHVVVLAHAVHRYLVFLLQHGAGQVFGRVPAPFVADGSEGGIG